MATGGAKKTGVIMLSGSDTDESSEGEAAPAPPDYDSDNDVDVVTKNPIPSKFTETGPSVVVIAAGNTMYYETSQTGTVNARAARIYKKALTRFKNTKSVAVLSLEGRKTIDVQLASERNSAGLSYFVLYPYDEGASERVKVLVDVLPPTGAWPFWRITRRVHTQCDPTGGVMKDDPGVACLFDDESNELLYAKTPKNYQTIQELFDNAETDSFDDSWYRSDGIELSGVLSPSVQARHRLEATIEDGVLNVQRRTLVPWPDFSHPDIATLTTYVEDIVAFFRDLKPSDLAILRCSSGWGRSGVAMMIGYLCYNETADDETMLKWFEANHKHPDEATDKWRGSPTLRAIVRKTIATNPDERDAKRQKLKAGFVDLAA